MMMNFMFVAVDVAIAMVTVQTRIEQMRRHYRLLRYGNEEEEKDKVKVEEKEKELEKKEEEVLDKDENDDDEEGTTL